MLQTQPIPSDTQDLFAQLIAWELLGREDLCPKILLRQVPFAELCVVAKNIADEVDAPYLFMLVDMVNVEMMYRKGQLQGDWDYRRTGARVALRYQPKKEVGPTAVDRQLMAVMETSA